MPVGQHKLLMSAIIKAIPLGPASANSGVHLGSSQQGPQAGPSGQQSQAGPHQAEVGGNGASAHSAQQQQPEGVEGADQQQQQQGEATPAPAADATDSFVREVLQQFGAAQSAPAGAQATPTGMLSWQDPQIYLKHLGNAKSLPTHLDIVDFVSAAAGVNVVEEVVSDSLNGQLVYKSGPAKPKLESINQNQWSIANLAILYKLLEEGVLAHGSMLDYLSYTTRVHQLLISHDQGSVFLYDREYRKLQHAHKFRWGTDISHIQMVFLKPRVPRQPQQTAKRPTYNAGGTQYTAQGREICRNYNARGCKMARCRFDHVCAVSGCSQKHSAAEHSAAAIPKNGNQP
jgi:hypothetical protein